MIRRSLLAFTFLLVTCGLTSGQTFRGAINGTVMDPSGAVVPGAKVDATEKATGITHATESSSDGEFAFQDIPLGSYKLTFTASGFPVYAVDNVTVTAGEIYTLPVKLTMSQQSTTIEVSAAALSMDTTTQTQTMTISTADIQDVPLNGRDFTQLVQVSPGYGGYSVGGFGSLNGTRANQMNWQIDGIDNNDFWHNIPAVNQGGVSGIAGVILPIDAIDEFSAQTQSGAEAGRNAGGTVNVVLKSGGNDFHGSAYYYNRNEFFGAASPFFTAGPGHKKPPLRNQNWGGSLGGPIFKNKTFFFLAFERQQYSIGLSGLATEPSTAWIAKSTALLNNCANPPTCTSTYGPYAAVTPSALSAILLGTPSAISPVGFWPANIVGGLPATLNNFFSSIASTGFSNNGVIKLDHNFSDKHRLSARWYGGQGSQTAPLGSSPALGTASSNLHDYFETAPLHVFNYSIVLNSLFTSRLTNQILFGINYFNQTFNDANSSFDTKALGLFLSPDATIKGKPIHGAANVAISNFENVGITPPEGRNDITGHLTDIISYNVGKHQFRFGGEVRQGRVNEFYFRRGTGKFSFDSSQGPWSTAVQNCNVNTTPYPASCVALGFSSASDAVATGALADFLAGDVANSSIAVGNAERFVTVNAFNFFSQDNWQVTRRLNLNFGLRYEYFGPLHSSNKDLAVFIPGRGLVIQGNGIDSIFPADKNNFAPRIGFAYQPTASGNMVVRGGIGVFYDQINMNPFLDYRPPISAADGLQDNPIGPATVSNYSTNVAGQTSYTWVKDQQIFNGITTCNGNFATDPNCLTPNTIFNVASVSQTFRAPYFFNYNLQVEQSFGKLGILQVGYVGSVGHKLSVMLNINQPPLAGGPRPFFAQFPNYGAITQLNSVGNSNYNSLQTTFRLREWHGLSSQFAYTWAHALDQVSQYRAVLPLDSSNLAAEYGNSDYDTRHNFTANLLYAIPGSSHGPRILTHGWEVSSLVVIHSGQPFNITGGSSRPGFDLVSNPFAGVSHNFKTFPDGTKGTQWVNPGAFVPSAGLGNLSRNKFYGPGYSAVDLTVFKNIPIRERLKLQLRMDLFNLFNRINLSGGGPGTVNGDGTVRDTIGDFNGAPGLGPGEQFNMQIAAKIVF